jgi:hypothetical protein
VAEVVEDADEEVEMSSTEAMLGREAGAGHTRVVEALLDAVESERADEGAGAGEGAEVESTTWNSVYKLIDGRRVVADRPLRLAAASARVTTVRAPPVNDKDPVETPVEFQAPC